MDTKLWIILITVSTMISLSSQDFGGLMGSKDKEKAKLTTPPPQEEYNPGHGNNQYNQYGHQQQGHKGNKGMSKPQKQGFNPFDKEQLKQELKLDKLDQQFKPDKLDKQKGDKQQSNYTQGYNSNNNYNYSNLAIPVENPVYSSYVPRPYFDDGSYSQPQQYAPQYGSPPPQYGYAPPPPQYGSAPQYGQYRTPSVQSYNNLTAYNTYRQMYGYKTPSQSNYGGQPPPNYQQAPVYGNGQPSYNEASAQYGAPPSYNAPAQYGEAPSYGGQSYGAGNAPVYGLGNANNYNEGAGYDHIDYSKYVNPMPYSEVSEYISPAQYNQYTSTLYNAYNVPAPTYQNQNYTSNVNYNTQYKLSVAVVVVDGRFGWTPNEIKGTLFITEIYPQICVVSGVLQGMPPNYRYGIAVHDFGDLTNGCQSIGGHYNPTHKSHGNIGNKQSHIGDLGNIQTDPFGIAFVNKIARGQFSIQGNFPVAGRSIGICEKQDDLGLGGNIQSMRDGNCGYIQACGIVGLSNDGAVHSGYY